MDHILLGLLLLFLNCCILCITKTPNSLLVSSLFVKKYVITLALLKLNKVLQQEAELGQASRT